MQAQETQKLIRKLAFAEAIKVEDGPTMAELVEEHLKFGTGGIAISDKYDGPRLPEGPKGEEHHGQITPEFIEEMIEFFKKDGRLPVKYVWQILLGANRAFLKEESLVDYTIEEGTTIDGKLTCPHAQRRSQNLY